MKGRTASPDGPAKNARHRPGPAGPGKGARRLLPVIGLCAALALATAAAYWGVGSNGFIWQDDGQYVTHNAQVRSGISRQSVAWAITTTQAANWHPVTWLSHMADVQLFGLDPGRHHFSSLLFHILNTVLLFLLLFRMTGARWRSAFAAALFALHPLHVESVAWIAERKDVLSTFFWLLTLSVWLAHVRSKKRFPYVLALAFFALGLMAKPMLVTLPFTLLLLDYWPLRRLVQPPLGQGPLLRSLLAEKIPFFILSAASCVVTVAAQQGGGSVVSLDRLPLAGRLANAVWAYALYLFKTLWPSDLSIFYPLPAGGHPSGQVVLAALVLLGLSAGAFRLAAKAPYLLFGWLWYLGTLVPVIGLVQVGSQALADRYTYVPLIGPFVAMAWGLSGLVKENRTLRHATAAAASALLAALLLITRVQTTYWADTETLFGHALAVTSDNWMAHDYLGLVMAGKGRMQEAIDHHAEALRLNPGDHIILNNLATALRGAGRREEAVANYREALRIRPDAVVPMKGLGWTLLELDRLPEAVEWLARAAKLDPGTADSHLLYGRALDREGRTREALEQFESTVRIAPDSVEALTQMGLVLEKMGRLRDATAPLEKSVRLDPGSVEARVGLGAVLEQLGRVADALEQYDAALRIRPDSTRALVGKGVTLGKMNLTTEAIACLEKAVMLYPNHTVARLNLGVALSRSGHNSEALDQFREVLRLHPGDVQALTAMEEVRRMLREGR